MSLPAESQPLSMHLFQLRIILIALFAGIVVGLVSVVLVVQPPANPINVFLFEPVAMGFLVLGAILAWRFLPPAMDRVMRRQILRIESASTEPREALIRQRVARLLMGHQTQIIVTAAIVEAPAMLGIVGYTLGATKVGPFAALVGAALILMLNPTRSAQEDWLQMQFRLLDEEAATTKRS